MRNRIHDSVTDLAVQWSRLIEVVREYIKYIYVLQVIYYDSNYNAR